MNSTELPEDIEEADNIQNNAVSGRDTTTNEPPAAVNACVYPSLWFAMSIGCLMSM